jgi:hypothetical protein
VVWGVATRECDKNPAMEEAGSTVCAFFVVTAMSKTRSSKQTQVQTQSGAYLMYCQWRIEVRSERHSGGRCKSLVQIDLHFEWTVLCKNELNWI